MIKRKNAKKPTRVRPEKILGMVGGIFKLIAPLVKSVSNDI